MGLSVHGAAGAEAELEEAAVMELAWLARILLLCVNFEKSLVRGVNCETIQ